jgi:hypothetical protein
VVGETVILGVVNEPGVQAYDPPVTVELAVSVTLVPEQIVAVAGFTLITGVADTVAVPVDCALHPFKV